MNELSMRKRIEITFVDQTFEFEDDRFNVPVIGRECIAVDTIVDAPEMSGASRWLTAGQSRYCPEDGTWVRVEPLPI